MITGWKYYMPDDGETAADARDLRIHQGHAVKLDFDDASEAAEYAAEDYYTRSSGDVDFKNGDACVIIDRAGNETAWMLRHEVEVVTHYVEVQK
jgi:hypothetical protein